MEIIGFPVLPVLQNLQFAGVFLLLPCKWSCHGKEETYPKVLLWYLNQPPKKPCRGTLDDFLQYYEGEKKKSLKPPNYMLKVYGNKSKHPHTPTTICRATTTSPSTSTPRGPLWKGPRPNILLSDCASTIWECGNTAMNEPRRKNNKQI